MRLVSTAVYVFTASFFLSFLFVFSDLSSAQDFYNEENPLVPQVIARQRSYTISCRYFSQALSEVEIALESKHSFPLVQIEWGMGGMFPKRVGSSENIEEQFWFRRNVADIPFQKSAGRHVIRLEVPRWERGSSARTREVDFRVRWQADDHSGPVVLPGKGRAFMSSYFRINLPSEMPCVDKVTEEFLPKFERVSVDLVLGTR